MTSLLSRKDVRIGSLVRTSTGSGANRPDFARTGTIKSFYRRHTLFRAAGRRALGPLRAGAFEVFRFSYIRLAGSVASHVWIQVSRVLNQFTDGAARKRDRVRACRELADWTPVGLAAFL